MADFSKQYCENVGMEFPGDFDILEVAERITPGYYLPLICEGYGFIAISKELNGKITLAFPSEGECDEVHWENYEDVVK